MGAGQFVGVTSTQALLNHVASKYGEDSEAALDLLQKILYGVGAMHAVYAAYVTYGHMLRVQRDPSGVKATSVLAAGGAGLAAFSLSGLPKLLGNFGGGAHATKLAGDIVGGLLKDLTIETAFQSFRGAPAVKRAPTWKSAIADSGTRFLSDGACRGAVESRLVKSFGDGYLGKKDGKVFPQASFMT